MKISNFHPSGKSIIITILLVTAVSFSLAQYISGLNKKIAKAEFREFMRPYTTGSFSNQDPESMVIDRAQKLFSKAHFKASSTALADGSLWRMFVCASLADEIADTVLNAPTMEVGYILLPDDMIKLQSLISEWKANGCMSGFDIDASIYN